MGHNIRVDIATSTLLFAIHYYQTLPLMYAKVSEATRNLTIRPGAIQNEKPRNLLSSTIYRELRARGMRNHAVRQVAQRPTVMAQLRDGPLYGAAEQIRNGC